jgi:molybdate transport system ATP-binding protein
MSAELAARFVKRFGEGVAVAADLRQPTDRFSVAVLFGPSGCGKTTTLRCLAGLERPDEGRIAFDGTPWFDAGRRACLSPQERDVGYLFQEYALFPHLTVGRNLAYGLRGVSRGERRRRVGEMLDLFGLGGLEDRYPHQISGGEQQRVALARVLARRPRLLLLDEPLSALDQATRAQLRAELRRLLAGFGVPVVLVTHDRAEATSLGDHVVVLDRGRVAQHGAVDEVFSRPRSAEVAQILGVENILPGRVVGTEDGLATVAVCATRLVAPSPGPPVTDVFVCIRAEEVVLQKPTAPSDGSGNRLAGVVNTLTPEGPLVRVGVDCGFTLHALVTRTACAGLGLRTGEPVAALVEARSVHLIARN